MPRSRECCDRDNRDDAYWDWKESRMCQEEEEYEYAHEDYIGEHFVIDSSGSEAYSEDVDAEEEYLKQFHRIDDDFDDVDAVNAMKANIAELMVQVYVLEAACAKKDAEIKKLKEDLQVMTEWFVESEQPETVNGL
jgi:hypothetical protein